MRSSTAWMAVTLPGTSATMQVMAVTPYTPRALNVFRSACAPAPALLSEPAMVSATGGDEGMAGQECVGTRRHRKRIVRTLHQSPLENKCACVSLTCHVL